MTEGKTATALRSSPLPRLNLFEFHEQAWLPAVFREAITEILRVLGLQIGIDRAIRPVLEEVLQAQRQDCVVDLCSGAGGPIVAIQQQLAASGRLVKVLLTDKFPNAAAGRTAEALSGGLVRAVKTPVDATMVPPELTGVRTLFNAFHHFQPETARRILADAVAGRQAIAIFEITERSLPNTLSIFFTSFLCMLLLLPRMRNKRAAWWAFTYVIPFLPVALGWDGLVSCLRSYTAHEFEQITAGLGDGVYRWSSGRIPVPGSFGLTHVNYFLGLPR